MSSLHLVGTIALVSLVSLASAACGGAGFEPASKIKGLRILAVEKDPPYAPPADPSAPEDAVVNLRLLYWDGKATTGSPRDIRFDFFRCVNPPGDLYYNCFGKLLPGGIFGGGPLDGGADASQPVDADLPDAFADAMVPEGGGARVTDLDHVISRRVDIPPGIVHEKAPGVTPYGLVYVLFTACAGHLGPIDPGSANGLPIGCFDEAGHALGPDDFVPGYSAIYVYDNLRNSNPIVTDFLFRGASFKGSSSAADTDVPHVERCLESDRSNCPNLDVKADVDRISAEIDPEAKDLNGQPLQEQLWVAFYSTDGDFTNSLRLVNDSSRGWNDDNGTRFRAPTVPGPLRIWAIVHDNRGGVAWAEGKIIVD